MGKNSSVTETRLVKGIYCLFYRKWDSNHSPTNARFNRPAGAVTTGAWSARTNDKNQWIQVTFIDDITNVTAVGIQGRQDMDQWVTKFKIAYSVDGTYFITQDKVS